METKQVRLDEIRKSDQEIFEWFEEEWNKSATADKRFCRWLKARYTEHLEQHNANKNLYFKRAHDKDRYESMVYGTNKLTGKVKNLFGFLTCSAIGLSMEKIVNFISKQALFVHIPRWLLIIIIIILFILAAAGIAYGFKVVFGIAYVEKLSKVDQEKETWLRHGEAIIAYQKELFGYLWGINGYESAADQKQKEELLIKNILAVWEKDNERFQENMK